MKILLLDVETAPNTAHLWGLYNQNVGISQLIESSYVLCWAAKWLGERQMMWERSYGKNGCKRKPMLNKIHGLLSEADAVIHFNGTKFDIPTLNREFIVHHMVQPAPYKEMDLLKVARNKFKFTSNKMDYICGALGLGRKTKHHGHELWLGCMNDSHKDWKIMESYNRNDVVIMERLYYRLLPWMKTHANYCLFTERDLVCPNCGSDHYQRRGFAYTQVNRYTRHQCQSCYSWFRGTANGKKFVAI